MFVQHESILCWCQTVLPEDMKYIDYWPSTVQEVADQLATGETILIPGSKFLKRILFQRRCKTVLGQLLEDCIISQASSPSMYEMCQVHPLLSCVLTTPITVLTLITDFCTHLKNVQLYLYIWSTRWTHGNPHSYLQVKWQGGLSSPNLIC